MSKQCLNCDNQPGSELFCDECRPNCLGESITVNGVVFERVESFVYRNGAIVLEMVESDRWWVSVSGRASFGGDTPEQALNKLTDRANSWAPVLRELARINGGAA